MLSFKVVLLLPPALFARCLCCRHLPSGFACFAYGFAACFVWVLEPPRGVVEALGHKNSPSFNIIELSRLLCGKVQLSPSRRRI